jgi:RHS repeat-associated protein
VFYIHADHLGTPRVVTRSTVATGANAPSSANATSPGAINKAVWRWDSDPFGTSLDNSKPTENPQIITGTATVQQAGTFKQNHRFPGQLADGESAKYYNYFRDYDSTIGRYITSDPTGLGGGINTYAYVTDNPLKYVDPRGLRKQRRPGDDGGGGPDFCPLVGEVFLGLHAMGLLSTWLCIYDCNKVCPGNREKIVVEVQWDIPPHGGCYNVIPRPPGM